MNTVRFACLLSHEKCMEKKFCLKIGIVFIWASIWSFTNVLNSRKTILREWMNESLFKFQITKHSCYRKTRHGNHCNCVASIRQWSIFVFFITCIFCAGEEIAPILQWHRIHKRIVFCLLIWLSFWFCVWALVSAGNRISFVATVGYIHLIIWVFCLRCQTSTFYVGIWNGIESICMNDERCMKVCLTTIVGWQVLRDEAIINIFN